MILIDNYKKVVFENYVTFSGRATRSEYWYFFLTNLIIGFIIGLVGIMIGLSEDQIDVSSSLYSWLILLPSIAVGVRRIHDSDKSGWFILVPFYNLYLLVIKGNEGPNRFGSDQLADSDVTSEQPVHTSDTAPASGPATTEASASEMK